MVPVYPQLAKPRATESFEIIPNPSSRKNIRVLPGIRFPVLEYWICHVSCLQAGRNYIQRLNVTLVGMHSGNLELTGFFVSDVILRDHRR
jgi:hypothetical protein